MPCAVPQCFSINHASKIKTREGIFPATQREEIPPVMKLDMTAP